MGSPISTCGARVTGGICGNVPASGKARCHAHHGAPHAGAPLGNRNAARHGKYVGGRDIGKGERKKQYTQAGNIELKPIVRLERLIAARSRGSRRRHRALNAPSLKWHGPGVRKFLLRLATKLDAELPLAFGRGGSAYDYALACRDMLRSLCAMPERFATEEAFLDGICAVFSAIDSPNWLRATRGALDLGTYYYAWRRCCANLYEEYCPPIARSGARRSRAELKQERAAVLPTVAALRDKLESLARWEAWIYAQHEIHPSVDEDRVSVRAAVLHATFSCSGSATNWQDMLTAMARVRAMTPSDTLGQINANRCALLWRAICDEVEAAIRAYADGARLAKVLRATRRKSDRMMRSRELERYARKDSARLNA